MVEKNSQSRWGTEPFPFSLRSFIVSKLRSLNYKKKSQFKPPKFKSLNLCNNDRFPPPSPTLPLFLTLYIFHPDFTLLAGLVLVVEKYDKFHFCVVYKKKKTKLKNKSAFFHGTFNSVGRLLDGKQKKNQHLKPNLSFFPRSN